MSRGLPVLVVLQILEFCQMKDHEKSDWYYLPTLRNPLSATVLECDDDNSLLLLGASPINECNRRCGRMLNLNIVFASLYQFISQTWNAGQWMKLQQILGATSFIWKSCKGKLYSPFVLLPFYFLPPCHNFLPDLFFNNGDVVLLKFPGTWHMQSREFWNRTVSIPEKTPFYMLVTYQERFSAMG